MLNKRRLLYILKDGNKQVFASVIFNFSWAEIAKCFTINFTLLAVSLQLKSFKHALVVFLD